MRTKEEILEQVNDIMEKAIRPMLLHGGEVKVIDFDEETGTLRTLLSGFHPRLC